jgi:hypothetical protein
LPSTSSPPKAIGQMWSTSRADARKSIPHLRHGWYPAARSSFRRRRAASLPASTAARRRRTAAQRMMPLSTYSRE